MGLVFLEDTTIWDGFNHNGGFLGVPTNTDGDSATALLEVSHQVEEGDSHGRSVL